MAIACIGRDDEPPLSRAAYRHPSPCATQTRPDFLKRGYDLFNALGMKTSGRSRARGCHLGKRLRSPIRLIAFSMLAVLSTAAQNTTIEDEVESVFPDAQALCLDLHQHPELSSHETRTAAC